MPEFQSYIRVLGLYFSILGSLCFAQAQVAPDIYVVELLDKNNNLYSIDHPEEFLSERSLNRRIKQGIEVDWSDLPVSNDYIDSLSKFNNVSVISISKWFNSVAIRCNDTLVIGTIQSVSFVKSITKKTTPYFKEIEDWEEDTLVLKTNNISDVLTDSHYGFAWDQIHLNNGQYLHQLGFKGEGKYIAVIDAGFTQLPSIELLQKLWDKHQILDYKDFVEQDNRNIFLASEHGTRVLSIIGTDSSGTFVGTAPDASFILLRSEDVRSEYPVEEEYWISAAEYADSLGVDIINSSLGYSLFTDTSMNYSYEDMDGKTTRISNAADLAMSKGILVVASAGNSGNTTWKYITAPADALFVLAIGAIDKNGIIADFSGRGPSYDLRIKPDVVAMGKNAYSINSNNQIVRGNGTSLSAPVITGLSACLWQAFPDYSAIEIANAIRQSSNHYNFPDTITGYGIPDFFMAYQLLYNFNSDTVQNIELSVYPNPTSDYFNLQMISDEEILNLYFSLYDLNGKLLLEKKYQPQSNYFYTYISKPGYIASGIYFYKIMINNRKLYTGKICINNY